MKILVVSENLPVSDFHGGCQHLAALESGLLDQSVQVEHLWLAKPQKTRPFRLGLNLDPRIRLHVQQCWSVCNWFLPYKTSFSDPAKCIHSIVGQRQPKLVLIDRAPSAEHWKRSSSCPAWVITHDILHKRFEMGFLDASNGPRIDWEIESAWLTRADGIIAIQDNEAAFFKKALPEQPVITVPHPVQSSPLPKDRIIPNTLLFVGGSSKPNIEGLLWFLNEVFPTILMTHPSVRLKVVGSVAEHIPDHASMDRIGHAKQLQSHYAEAHICIAPILSGTGLKIKAVEAMGYGRPLIGTQHATEGLRGLAGAAVSTVSPQAFAKAVIQTLSSSDSFDRIVSRQNQWINAHLVPEIALKPLIQLLSQDL